MSFEFRVARRRGLFVGRFTFSIFAHGAMIRAPTFSGPNSRCSGSHRWKKTSAKQKLHDQNRLFRSRVLFLPRCARTFTISREEENSSSWSFPQKSPKPKNTGRERVIVASSIFPSSTSEGRESNDADDNALILYTKPGCCLCEGLEEKLKAVLELAHKSQQRETTTTTGHVVNSNGKKSRNTHIALDLREYALEIRDVSLKKEWADAHAGEIPVLFVGKRGDADDAQTASKVKRPTPRVSVERLKFDLEKHLASVAARTSETNRDDMGGGGGGGGGGWTVISAKPF